MQLFVLRNTRIKEKQAMKMSDKAVKLCDEQLEQLEMAEKLAELVKKYDLREIKIKDDEITIKGGMRPCPPPPPPMPFDGKRPEMRQGGIPSANESDFKLELKDEKISGNIVKSPIVGTYYSAPAPGKAPFVTVGKTVKKGDTIMIIESMKLMNEVQSEFDGVVTKILVKDGEAVEYDQNIMIIE